MTEEKKYALKIKPAQVKFNIEYEKELNEQQLAVVTSGVGPKLVIAGAGSGKTRTVTYRVAWLLEHNVHPNHILLVTFTNKAAHEMMHRVALLTGLDVRHMWGGTFHHIGNLILRRHADLVGYNPSYVILDREDQKDMISACMSDLKFKPDKKRFPSSEVLAEIFSLSHNTSKSLESILELRYPHFFHLTGEVTKISENYVKKKRECNSVDYDDLLLLWKNLMEERAAIRKLYSLMFNEILVDEYQDTNLLQAEVVDLLATENHNPMVVGDDSQSIYSFRGANFENIINFPKRYPDCIMYKLEVNYRSRPEILHLANQIIVNNVRQFHKELSAVRQSGPRPALISVSDANEQSEFIAQRMLELNADGIPFKEMAVLYRAHFHSLELQMELTKRRIPFIINSGLRFFEHRHIKDVVAYIKVILNQYDELAWKRLLKLQPGIGTQTADKLWMKLKTSRAVFATLDQLDELIPRGAKEGWTTLKELFLKLDDDAIRNSPATMIDLILSAYYKEYLMSNFADYVARLDDLEQLRNYAMQYKDTINFLSELSLLGNVETEDVIFGSGENDKAKLSTVHQAKGLEWKIVFVIWLVDGRFPSSRALRETEGEEEERRLFYVSVTRCKDELYLLYPAISREFSRGSVFQQPSRFLKEIDSRYYDRWRVELTYEDYEKENEETW